MGNIRINQLPEDLAPISTDVVAVDSSLGGTTRKVPLPSLADQIRPIASQPVAEAGSNNSDGMSPLRTKQQIDARLVDEATARARTDNVELTTALRVNQLLAGDVTTNPYAGPYPDYMFGVGGIGFYDIGARATTTLAPDDGPAYIYNTLPYGSLDLAMGMSITANSKRPGFITGLTHPAQTGAYDDHGSCTLGIQNDTIPLMWSGTGVYTATTFAPYTPITLSDTVKIAEGMWIRTEVEHPPHNGQITGWTVNGSGQVIQITVSNWYPRGGPGGVAGTPASNARATINPQNKPFVHLNTLFLNSMPLTGDITNGGYTITNLSSTEGLVDWGQYVTGVGIQAGSYITGVDHNNKIAYLTKPTTATTSDLDIRVSCGVDFNRGACAEIDVFNNAASFEFFYIEDTGNLTNGSYEVTNVGSVGAWRAGVFILGTGPALNWVDQVDASTNKLLLKYPATISGTGVALKGINQIDDCGMGYDFVSVVNKAQSAVTARGNFWSPFIAYGADFAAFLALPHVMAGQPKHGFRVDTRIHGVTETAFSQGDHAVNNFEVKPDGTVNTTASYQIDGITALDNAAWPTFNPAVAPATGAITTIGAKSVAYKQIGKVMSVDGAITITTNGTGATYITVGLPVAAVRDTPIYGRSSTGAALTGLIPAGNAFAILQLYNGSYPGADGVTLNFAATYEVA